MVEACPLCDHEPLARIAWGFVSGHDPGRPGGDGVVVLGGVRVEQDPPRRACPKCGVFIWSEDRYEWRQFVEVIGDGGGNGRAPRPVESRES